ncbi:hypothetical protein [Novosphingobium sp. PhB165]|uniref:hypothetical protein n=1 Tax=Novosphingobium sp. PhB165 TaxID=2485105 RepID=UPI00140554BE|nr:hypothetical protein [Novosphingobium sp. PhB165]
MAASPSHTPLILSLSKDGTSRPASGGFDKLSLSGLGGQSVNWQGDDGCFGPGRIAEHDGRIREDARLPPPRHPELVSVSISRPVLRFDPQCALAAPFPRRSEQAEEWILKQVQDDDSRGTTLPPLSSQLPQ